MKQHAAQQSVKKVVLKLPCSSIPLRGTLLSNCVFFLKQCTVAEMTFAVDIQRQSLWRKFIE